MALSSASRPLHLKPGIRISICDRNRLNSQLLADSLDRNPQFEIADVTGPEGIVSSAFAHKPDLIVLSADFDTGKRKGFQLARSLNTHQPDILIVMLVDANDRDTIIDSFRCGATGVFCRTEPPAMLWSCLQRVSGGEIWAGPGGTQHLLQMVRSTPSWNGVDNARVRSLAKREMEVAELASRGQSNKQIAEQLNLSEHTVKNYLFRVFEKLGVANRFELLFLLYNARVPGEAARLGIGDPSSPLETHLKAAEEGSATAQFMMGLAYLHGTRVGKNSKSAYCWLRMSQRSSALIQHQSYAVLEQLKAELGADEVAVLDRKVEINLGKLSAPESQRSVDSTKQRVELPALWPATSPIPPAPSGD
jgi:two-component system, NarL family, nitrate/nitrite response regulator NarL